MIYIYTVTLLVILFGNYYLSKSYLYPPVIYSITWLLCFIGLIISGDGLYQISSTTLTIYLIGVLSFSFGGLLCLTINANYHINNYYIYKATALTYRSLDVLLVILILLLPIYWAHTIGSIDVKSALVLAEVRRQSVEGNIVSPLSNLVNISIFVAMAMHYLKYSAENRLWKTYLSILLAIVYGSLTGTKGNGVIIIIALTFISLIRSKTIDYKVILLSVVVAIIFFSTGLMLVNFAYSGIGNIENAFALIISTLQNYALGGLVAFDSVVQAPENYSSAQDVFRFFIETANSLGANYEIPSVHAKYTDISEYQDTNVYTIYFTYYKDYGWLGLVIGLSTIGYITTKIYLSSLNNVMSAVVFYGILMSSTILSFKSEHFFLGLNLYIKMIIFFYILQCTMKKIRIRPNKIEVL